MVHGGEDVITSIEGSRALLAQSTIADKRLIIYEGQRHDLAHEPDAEKVIGDIVAWVEAHVPPSAAPRQWERSRDTSLPLKPPNHSASSVPRAAVDDDLRIDPRTELRDPGIDTRQARPRTAHAEARDSVEHVSATGQSDQRPSAVPLAAILPP